MIEREREKERESERESESEREKRLLIISKGIGSLKAFFSIDQRKQLASMYTTLKMLKKEAHILIVLQKFQGSRRHDAVLKCKQHNLHSLSISQSFCQCTGSWSEKSN